MEKLTYHVVYDETYLNVPGFFVYLSDYSKAFKIYYSNNYGFNYYHIMGVDGNIDTLDEEFRKITFSVSDPNDELYEPLKTLHAQLKNPIFETLDRFHEGHNYLEIKKTDLGEYSIIIGEDIYGTRDNMTNCINVTLGDDLECHDWMAINAFFNNLENVAKVNCHDNESNQVNESVKTLRRI